MPHFLCLVDLALTAKANTSLIDSSARTIDIAAPAAAAGKISQHPAALFEVEENKKSSFFLQQPFALFCAPGNKLQSGVDEQQNCDKSDSGKLDGTPPNDDKKKNVFATAAIISFISSEPPKFTPQSRETFLFGGFELITNVKTVEVHVSKTSKPGEETYLTTCKGIPMRDMPDLRTTPRYIDGTWAEEESTSIENHDANCNTEKSEETTSCPDKGTTKAEEPNTFYKFILVTPGGPKPLERVRLKFVKSNTSCVHANSIIVRTLKVKGRLSDSIPTSNHSQKSISHPPLPVVTANFNPKTFNNERKDNMNNLASMMAMMRGNGMPPQKSAQQPALPLGAANFNPGALNNERKDSANDIELMMAMMGGKGMMGMPMAMQTNPQQQRVQQQQQKDNLQQEKNQAEIISSVAGLGIFLKSYEERTMNKLETMLTNMEMRIMTRLDGLAERLDVIEQGINDTNDEFNSKE